MEHVLILAAFQDILRKLDLNLLPPSSLLDLLLHIMVVPLQDTSSQLSLRWKRCSLEWKWMGVEHLVLVGGYKSDERMTHLGKANDLSLIAQRYTKSLKMATKKKLHFICPLYEWFTSINP